VRATAVSVKQASDKRRPPVRPTTRWVQAGR
jgi:hypothetical protein